MASAKDILDERLARGEITVEEHAKLAAQIAPQASSPQYSASAPAASGGDAAQTSGSPTAAPDMKSTLWHVFWVALAIIFIMLVSRMTTDVIASCVQKGSPESFCNSGVNWIAAYVFYAIAVAVGAWNAFALVRHKLSGRSQ